MTIRLYHQDSYMKEFDAKVLSINENETVLDQTLFFPGGGGQICDTGVINGIKVINIRKSGGRKIISDGNEITVDADIVHVLESKSLFKVGETVHGKIDWDKRYRIMRLHSASHIMEFFLFKVFGKKERLASYVSDKKNRDEYVSDDKFDKERLKKVEDLCNEFIAKNLPVEIRTHQTISEFRYWYCGEFKMPCGGTHPRLIGEIGKIVLKRSNPGSGKERVETYLID